MAVNSRRAGAAGPGLRVILLDLQGALAARFIGNNPRPERIRDEEQYKPYLVEWLRDAQARGWEVHIFTVRRADRKAVTLASIRDKTGGWQPDGAWFNDSAGRTLAADVKREYLDRLLRERKPAALFAVEQNAGVHAMYRSRGVAYCGPIHKPADLPALPEV